MQWVVRIFRFGELLRRVGRIEDAVGRVEARLNGWISPHEQALLDGILKKSETLVKRLERVDSQM